MHHHEENHGHYNRLFAIGVVLNVVFVLVETVAGFAANSLALLADAGHNLVDVLSLLLAWGAHTTDAQLPRELPLQMPTHPPSRHYRCPSRARAAITDAALMRELPRQIPLSSES